MLKIPFCNEFTCTGRPLRSKSGNDLAGAAATAAAGSTNNANANVTGMSAVDSPISGSPPSSSGGANANANANGAGIASGPRGEESLSATLERLRLNAQAAKHGAQNGGAGAIGSRGDGCVSHKNSLLQ